MDTCLSTRWLGISTSPLASMFLGAEWPCEHFEPTHSELSYVVVLSASHPRLLHPCTGPYLTPEATPTWLLWSAMTVSLLTFDWKSHCNIQSLLHDVTTVIDHRGSRDDFMSSCNFVTAKITINILLMTTRVDWMLQPTTSHTVLTICPLEKLYLESSAL